MIGEPRSHCILFCQLGSIIGISANPTPQDGNIHRAERQLYHPFGEISWEQTYDATLTDEDKGWLGERYDEAAGLQYLNARYYDPELALFIQPDWFPVTEQGVGHNRYAYANNDPINTFYPTGTVVGWLFAANFSHEGRHTFGMKRSNFDETGRASAIRSRPASAPTGYRRNTDVIPMPFPAWIDVGSGNDLAAGGVASFREIVCLRHRSHSGQNVAWNQAHSRLAQGEMAMKPCCKIALVVYTIGAQRGRAARGRPE